MEADAVGGACSAVNLFIAAVYSSGPKRPELGADLRPTRSGSGGKLTRVGKRCPTNGDEFGPVSLYGFCMVEIACHETFEARREGR